MARKRQQPTSRCIGYIRVSTGKQAESGLGLMDQTFLVRERVSQMKGELVAVHDDAGASGSLPISKRPGLQAALEAMQPGDSLVVAKRDRLARDPLLVMMIERDLEKRGCRLVSASGEGTDDDSPESKLMRHVIDAIAEYQRLVTKMRTRNALAIKRRKGEATGGDDPFGWDSYVDDNGMKRLRENEAEQKVIRQVAEMRARGDSWQDIEWNLNTLGVKTKRGGRWDRPRLFRMYRAVRERVQA